MNAPAAGVGDDAGPRIHNFGKLRAGLWAMLLARLFESLPLVSANCGAEMRMIAWDLVGQPEPDFQFDQSIAW
jgi:hypothetical protein